MTQVRRPTATKSRGTKEREGRPAASGVAVAAKHATIRDVSRLADVSRMTVSRVISEPDLVSPATRARVIQAIADLNWVPDRAAGSLSTRKTGFVAVMLPTLTNVNFSTMAKGLTDALRKKGYHLLITYNDYNLNEETEQLRNLLARRPEAVVLTGAMHNRASTALLLRSGVPVIEVADLPVQPFQHAVGFSNFQVGRTAAQYLIRCGFQKMGALASKPSANFTDFRGEERIQGFEDELRNHGFSTERVLRLGKPPVSYDHGVAAATHLLDRFPDVDAAFCVSDLSAIGVMMECQRRGLSIPDDLSLIGFGDFDIGHVTNPPLTTIRADFQKIGLQTGDLILDLLSGRELSEATRIDIGIHLIERGSVKSATAQ